MAPDGAVPNVEKLVSTLTAYADLITPWAEAVSAYMLADAQRMDRAMWRKNSAAMGRALRAEVTYAPTGATLKELQAAQVKLIRSIPLDAAKRVHDLAQEALLGSKRASVVAAQILAQQDVSEAKATLIARTEVSRVTSNLVQARSEHAGSVGYIWRTADDADVRESHRKMEGRFVLWNSPPTLDNLVGHAGCLPNCRCFAEPVFPDD